MIGEKDSKSIFESKNFHDLKKFLKEEVLVKKKLKKKHLPGSMGYGIMLGTLGYGTDPSQEIVLTLPFISPHLLDRYKVPGFGDGVVILNPDLVYDGAFQTIPLEP